MADLVKHYEIPVVATGGVINGEDVIEMTMVGAQAVGVCTAPLLQGLSWFKKCEMQTERWLEKHQLTSLDEIRGLALRFLPFEDRKIQLEFHFDPKQCTLCGLCEKVCPYNAREVVPSDEEDGPVQLKWSKNDCRLCGLCAEVCKTGALSIENWPPNKGVFAP